MSERIPHMKQQKKIIYLINGTLMELQSQMVLEKQQDRQTTLEKNLQEIQIMFRVSILLRFLMMQQM